MGASFGKYLLFFGLTMSLWGIGCPIRIDKCGPGNFYCNGLYSIYPYSEPVSHLGGGRYNNFKDSAVLLSDGKVIARREHYGDTTVTYDLKQVCQTDMICYVSFFSSYWYENPHFEALVVTPTKACVMRDFNTIVQEYANSGPDSTRLVRAVDACLFDDELFVLDAGDSTVKVFDELGRFVDRFSTGFDPRILRVRADYIYVLNRAGDTIRQFDQSGQPTGYSFGFLSGITSFDICGGLFIVADRDGARLNVVTFQGQISENKTDYCIKGTNFQIGKIINITADEPGFYAVDIEKDYVITFGDYVWDNSSHY
jgi:hypothetical protein